MIIYNKYKYKRNVVNIPARHVTATRPPLTKENKDFLKLLKLKVKHHV